MYGIHFFENNTLVLSQFLKYIPSVDEDIKIKGRKGKVFSVNMVKENSFHVHVIYEKVIKKLKTIPEVVEAHYTTGVYSIFMKIVCRNTEHLREVLNEKVQSVEGVERTETIISLEESINRNVDMKED